MKKITLGLAIMLVMAVLVSPFAYGADLLISSNPEEEMVVKVEPENLIVSGNIKEDATVPTNAVTTENVEEEETANTLISTNTTKNNVVQDEDFYERATEFIQSGDEKDNFEAQYRIISFRETLRLAVTVMRIIVLTGIIYLIIESIFIIINKNTDAIWKKVINIFMAILGLPASYGIISLAIAIKLTSDKKAVKLIANVVVLIVHLFILFALSII